MRRTTLAVLGAVCALAAVGSGAGSAQAACSNEAIRVEQHSTALPECRAYEMVSPPDKNGSDISSSTFFTQSAQVGDSVAFASTGAFAGANSLMLASTYVGSRTGAGWNTTPVDPVQTNTDPQQSGYQLEAFSNDLTRSVMLASDPQPMPGVAEGGGQNLYVHNDQTGSYQLLTPFAGPNGINLFAKCNGAFAGASSDFSRVVFESSAKLTPDASIDSPGCPLSSSGDLRRNIFEATGNGAVARLQLVDILPNGEIPDEGGLVGGLVQNGHNNGAIGSAYIQDQHAVSDDGSRIFWTTVAPEQSGERQIYVRIDGRETVQVSASKLATPEAPQEAQFLYATPDGRYAYFLSVERLTEDSTTFTEGPLLSQQKRDLYRFDVDTGELVDLTANADEPADALGVLGVSDDGQTVYFAANGFLTAASEAVPDVDSVTPGFRRPKLYVSLRGGAEVRYVATLAGLGESAAQEGIPDPQWLWDGIDVGVSPKVSEVSPDGRYLAFKAGVANSAGPPADFAQIYQFDALASPEGDPTCVSCAPGGEPNAGAAFLAENPTVNQIGGSLRQSYMPTFVFPSGDVAFATAQALVPADKNDKFDVYLWSEGKGAQLVSTGTSPQDSFFGDASPSGGDIYFLTRQRLVGADRDANLDLYDARVEGGFPEPPAPPPPCSGEGCQGTAVTSPAVAATGSAGLNGFGNATPKPKRPPCGKSRHKVGHKGKVRCVKKHAPKKRGGKSHRRPRNHSTRVHG